MLRVPFFLCQENIVWEEWECQLGILKLNLKRFSIDPVQANKFNPRSLDPECSQGKKLAVVHPLLDIPQLAENTNVQTRPPNKADST